MKMTTTTFKYDETTEKTFRRLKATYGATSKAEVVRIPCSKVLGISVELELDQF